MIRRLRSFLKKDDAVAAVEAGLLFPVMLMMICGMIDLGMALMLNMKVTNASQTLSDLLSRDTTVTTAMIDEAVIAARMSLSPYDTEGMGVDIVGIQFVGAALTPTERWRETRNMDENDGVLERSAGLGNQNEGVIAVTVRYVYTPLFSGYVMDDIEMEEESYVRGRRSGFITRI